MIARTKTFLATRFYLLYYIYRRLGKKMLVILFINCISVLLDGIGIALFVPLLQLMDRNPAAAESTDRLMHYVRSFFEVAGVSVSLTNIIILILVLFTAKALFFFITQYYQNRVLMNFVYQMQRSNDAALSSLSYKAFLKKSFGEFHYLLLEEPGNIRDAALSYMDTIKNVVVVLIYFSLCAFLDVKFTVTVILGAAVISGLFYLINKRIKTLSRAINRLVQQYSGISSEKIYNYKYLKATGALDFFIAKVKDFDDRLYAKNLRMMQLNIFSNVIREPMLIYMICALIVVQVAVFGESMGSMLVVLLLFYRTMGYFMSIQGSWGGFLRSIGSVENVIRFEKFLAEHREVTGGEEIKEPVRSLELQGVTVYFDSEPVLQDIDLRIEAKTVLALVGESGSGKSTLVNILCGLFLADKGRYLVNGEDITTLNRASLQQRIGYITQDATVFAGTVFENVTLWQDKTPQTLERFWKALHRSNLGSFVEELPDREDTRLGHNGINLSGGQKQRICIARELFKEVDMLIMDEATSALDAHTENEIRESIEALRGDLIIIMIAHRLATIRFADTVYLLEKGRITASGTFQELKNRSGYFREMAGLQGL